jgi:hypothetical protein
MAHMKASNSRATSVTTTCTGFPLAASWRYRFVSRSCAFQRFVERQPIGVENGICVVLQDGLMRWQFKFLSAEPTIIDRPPLLDSGKDAAMPEEESLKLLASD